MEINIPVSQLNPGGYKLRVISSDPKDTSAVMGHMLIIQDTSSFAVSTSPKTIQEDAFSSGNLSFYPNPAKNHIIVDEEGIKKIAIKDITGQILYKAYNSSGRININNLRNGVYFLVVYFEEKPSKVASFVKE